MRRSASCADVELTDHIYAPLVRLSASSLPCLPPPQRAPARTTTPCGRCIHHRQAVEDWEDPPPPVLCSAHPPAAWMRRPTTSGGALSRLWQDRCLGRRRLPVRCCQMACLFHQEHQASHRCMAMLAVHHLRLKAFRASDPARSQIRQVYSAAAAVSVASRVWCPSIHRSQVLEA